MLVVMTLSFALKEIFLGVENCVSHFLPLPGGSTRYE
jgi:hypothetical protein